MSSRIAKALDIANCYGGIDGEHHKTWVIDQMVRALTGCPMITKSAKSQTVAHGVITYTYKTQGTNAAYEKWVAEHCAGPDGLQSYEWDEGIAP